jgi:penicillin-binding protein 2
LKAEGFASLQRRTIINLTVIFTVVIIAFRLFQMQIVNQQAYDLKSSDNSIKKIDLEPLRGLFFDRNMNVVVSNMPAYTLRITPAYYDRKLDNILDVVLDEEPGFIDVVLNANKKYSKYLPLKIKRGVDFRVIAWLEENSEELTGVDYVIEMHRNYPAGIMASHLFGYTKEISPEQLNSESDYYKQGDYVGANGIEKTYEYDIRGEKGLKYIIVNSKRKEIGSYNSGSDDVSSKRGNDLVLGIDARAQKVAEEAFLGKTGALVAIEPETGEVLAMVSAPDYDLDMFSFITPRKYLNQLYSDPDKPLFNRATMSAHPPGSTYKILSAIAALDMGVITPSTTYYCGGGFTYGRFFKCHGSHGYVNVTRAIEKSCNTFFYQLIYKIGLDRLKQYAEMFGLGKKTNIDIGEEATGLITDENYYEKIYGEKWPRSIMASLGIGQGEIGITPLQLAWFTALVANNGKSFQPHVVKGYIDSKTKEYVLYKFNEINLNIKKDAFDIVNHGMYLVVNGQGTATHIRSTEFHISGKTGTAQNPHGKDHALFIGYAPSENPKIAVAVLVENVGFGGTHAAPIAKKVIETYLQEQPSEPKLIERSITKLENIKIESPSAN